MVSSFVEIVVDIEVVVDIVAFAVDIAVVHTFVAVELAYTLLGTLDKYFFC